jgi:hypothetical protein
MPKLEKLLQVIYNDASTLQCIYTSTDQMPDLLLRSKIKIMAFFKQFAIILLERTSKKIFLLP